MAIEESIKNKMKNYIKYSIDSLEIAMNMIECSSDLNDGQSEEADAIYNKISSAIKILEDI